MYPQTFLNTFWRLELRPQVFVAMSFAPQYQARFSQVIEPAIGAISIANVRLSAHRVDISKSGDSILTEISDGIAHSQLVLADVSSIGKDSISGRPYRNGNVLYEVGLALACRHPSEVLLVRDDHDDFLFDVSTVPHKTIDFTNENAAKKILSEELSARVREQQFERDARVRLAIDSLSGEELTFLKEAKDYTATNVWGREVKGLANWYGDATHRLLDKRLIKLMGEFENTDKYTPAFAFTPLGLVVNKLVNAGLRKFGSPNADAAPPDNHDVAAEPGAQPPESAA